jgi:NADPH:quinone reductase-like Zn-dependent oxidoreductase
MTTMKAIVTTGNGGYERLVWRDVPLPVPGPGEVLLQVLAAGINNTDINTRVGWYASTARGDTASAASGIGTEASAMDGWKSATPFPLIQGADCCGRVVALGDGSPAALLGQRVLVRSCMRTQGFGAMDTAWLGTDFDGAFAQYVKVPASEAFAVHSSWSDVALASMPCAWATAENMLERARAGPNDHILVTGASGGVGSAVVQLARRRGARVSALTQADKREAVLALGADRVFARDDDLLQRLGGESVDLVVDNVAGPAFGSLLQLLRRGGRYVSSGAIAGAMVEMDMRNFYLKDLRLMGCTAWDETVFPALVGYIERNEIRPLVARTFPLADIAQAQQEFLKKEHVGNFVLVPPTPVTPLLTTPDGKLILELTP